jgi:hypothetical protein
MSRNNALVKGDGGAIGLIENPSALARWMVASPEIANVIQDFESAAHLGKRQESDFHHGRPKAYRNLFLEMSRIW